ncbi:MAG TPA: hypothetical protein VJ487_05015 [Alphaproteobacteria bacterium]|nr:hypothetical protein [Alphaproteobacteria bacterium]
MISAPCPFRREKRELRDVQGHDPSRQRSVVLARLSARSSGVAG